MDTRQRNATGLVALIVLSLVFMGALMTALPAGDVAAAPPAAPTPVSYDTGDAPARYPVTFWSSAVITQDARVCYELADMDVLDLHVIGDAGANTVTVKLQHSNDNVNFVDGATSNSAFTETVNTLQQYALFGRWSCLYADVSSTDAVTITAIGVAK